MEIGRSFLQQDISKEAEQKHKCSLLVKFLLYNQDRQNGYPSFVNTEMLSVILPEA